MLSTKAALCISSIVLLASAQDPEATFRGLTGPGPGRTKVPTSTSSNLMSRRDLNKRCTGSCQECFGDGYTLCPGSSIFCYLPGDAYYGLDSCSSDSSGSDSTTTADASTSTSTSGADDICNQVGATCISCFGPTYLECPDQYHCYDPTDPQYDTCPNDSTATSTSTGDSATTTSSCEQLWGAGNVPCGTDSCYNPDIGESCCAQGYYCDAGYTCSGNVGKCCAPGSTSSSCSSDSGSGSSSSSGLLSSTTSDSSFATSTNGLLFTTSSATATDSGSSATGISQIGSNGAGALDLGRGLLVAAGVGALVL